MISRAQLTAYLHDLLACDNFTDYAPNGLQVEGRETIRSIATAVSASESVIDTSASMQVDALLVHHGYFWKGENPVITGMKRSRINKLLRDDINLFAYHLPLDCHPTLGNNACLGKLFGLQSIASHKVEKTPDLLWSGFLDDSKSAADISHFLTTKLQRTPLHIAGNDKPIKYIAWCSGGAQDFIENAHALGADAYISGEISERTYYQARELGIHYFSCGHHATERLGIQALGKHLASHFGLEHHFIDTDNPV
ncbi:MAG: Nif3-like dinuclear metal center hexameric protein [Legionella sp.]|nr:Nif3-like dinuclear metal center hexameric protein [Legionella sp.]